jgi:hypothetical protein
MHQIRTLPFVGEKQCRLLGTFSDLTRCLTSVRNTHQGGHPPFTLNLYMLRLAPAPPQLICLSGCERRSKSALFWRHVNLHRD